MMAGSVFLIDPPQDTPPDTLTVRVADIPASAITFETEVVSRKVWKLLINIAVASVPDFTGSSPCVLTSPSGDLAKFSLQVGPAGPMSERSSVP